MRRLASLLAVWAGLAGGCGGGDTDSEPARVTTVEAGRGLRVQADEYRFDPNRVVVSAPARDTRLEITVANRGSLAHNLKVFRGERQLGGTPTFQGGESRSGTVRLRAGSYKMVCTVGNHADLGMVGELQVRR